MRERRSQTCKVMVSQTLMLAVTLPPAPRRCWCSVLPRCHQTNTYEKDCCPVTAHMYLTPFCTAFSSSPSATEADTAAVIHHTWGTRGTPLGLAWAIASGYRATFLSELSMGPASRIWVLWFSTEICSGWCSAPSLPCMMAQAPHPSALWQFTRAARSGDARLFSELASSFVATLYLAKWSSSHTVWPIASSITQVNFYYQMVRRELFFAKEHVSKYLTISTFFNIMFPTGGNTELPETHYSP